jgi:hypothetical protein
MDFDWMNVELPQDIVARNAEHRARQAKNDVRVHAALLRRLGYDVGYAKRRLLGNQAWTWELVPGTVALSSKELKAEVESAYAR